MKGNEVLIISMGWDEVAFEPTSPSPLLQRIKRMLIQDNPLGFSKTSLGGHMGRSMMFLEMRTLVRSMPLTVTKDDFTKAIVDENILEKPTLSSRKESLIRLTQLYGMDPSRALFRVLWSLGHADLDSLPQLCLVCAYKIL